MFKSISFFHNNKTNVDEPIDIGNLVECMMFYEETTVFANRTILKQLFTFFGIEGIIELLEEKLLKIDYSEFFLGVHSTGSSNLQYHNVVQASLPSQNLQSDLIKLCQDLTGKTGKGRRIGNRIKSLIELTEFNQVVLDGSKNSILDQNFINDSSKSIIQNLIPELVDLSNVKFTTENTSSGIVMNTNLNYEEINKVYHKYTPVTHSSITSASILSHILASENEAWLASQNVSEISSSLITTDLLSKKFNNLIEKTNKSTNQLAVFQDFVLDESKAISEFVNQKKVAASEIIALLKKAKKFKKWISGVEPDKNLIKEYHNEVTKETWVDKLPAKGARWSIFTAIDFALTGGVGTAIGTGIGALDTFVLDKLITGWKPNQFIRKDLKPFLKK